MGVSYEKNKEHIKKWAQNNREHRNKICREWLKAHYVSKLAYNYEYMCRKFRAIKTD